MTILHVLIQESSACKTFCGRQVKFIQYQFPLHESCYITAFIKFA